MTSIDQKRKFDISATNDSDEATEPQTKKQKLDLTSNNDQKSSKNQQNNDNVAESIEVQLELPPEILVSIFCQLARADLSCAGAVCQHWWLVSKDESLAWFPLKTFTFLEDTYAYSMYSLCVSGVREKDLYFPNSHPDRKKLYPNAGPPVKLKSIECQKGAFFAILTDKQGNSAALALDEASPRFNENLMEALNHTEYFRLILSGVVSNNSPGSPESWRYYISYEANLSKVEQNIRAGEGVAIAIPFRQVALQKLLEKYQDPTSIDQYFKPTESYLPTVLPAITEQPQSLTGVKLHNYQINAINWMVTTEQEADEKFEVSPLLDTGVPNILVKYTTQEEKLVLFENASEHNLAFKPKGGVLADEMGLGKTLEMLGLILSNPMNQAPKNDPYFATKATLVLCPNHLVDQWVKEIEKHSEPKLNVIKMPTIAQVKKISYQQIIDADVVVVMYNLLKNKNYLSYPSHGSQIKMDAAVPHDRIDRIDKLLEELKDKSPEKIKGVILDHFHWHRIVMDEGHEVIGDEFTMDVINYLQRTFSWYMSGTPFPKIQALEGVRTFLDIFVERTISLHDDFIPGHDKFTRDNWVDHFCRPLTEVCVESVLNQFLMDNLVWRNTNQRVQEEQSTQEVQSR